MSYPRLMIASPHSGAGKTTVVCALIKALQNQGLTLSSFKSGPDFIDASYHSRVAKSPCRNLDSWLIPKKNLSRLFVNGFADSDLAVIEGAMGLFDGQGTSSIGSSAHLSKVLKIPVILLLDAKAMAYSAAALVYGFKNFDRSVKIKGLIFNNVASPRHLNILKNSLKKSNLPLLGYLPKDKQILFKKRHLGLHLAHESESIDKKIEIAASLVQKNFNLDLIIKIARQAPSLETHKTITKSKPSTVIGVAYDDAFNFYYRDNLDLLKANGAQIKYFSPITDKSLPSVDGLYFGGGYPELHAQKLAANNSLKHEIKTAASDGMPVYAECGGYLYLSKTLSVNQKTYDMVNIFETEASMEKKFQALGYAKANCLSDNILSTENTTLKGHQFHYSKTTYPRKNTYAFVLSDGKKTGSICKNAIGSYLHVHFGSDFKIAKNFVKACQGFK